MNRERFTIQNPNNPDCRAHISIFSESRMIDTNGNTVLEENLTTRSGELYEERTKARIEWQDPCQNYSSEIEVIKDGYAPGIHTEAAAEIYAEEEVNETMFVCPFVGENGCKLLKDNYSIDS